MKAPQVVAAIKSLHDPVEWAVFEELANGTGSAASRTIDVFAISGWKSHLARAYEVKVSRSDWRRELDEPTKRAPWERLAHETWFACPAGIIPKAEVPEGWGLIEVREDLTVQRPIRARARELTPWPAPFVAAIARRSAEKRDYDAERHELGLWRIAGRAEPVRLADLRALAEALHRREHRPVARDLPRPRDRRVEGIFSVLAQKLGWKATTSPEALADALDRLGSATSGLSDHERQVAANALRRLLVELDPDSPQRLGSFPPQESATTLSLPARGAR